MSQDSKYIEELRQKIAASFEAVRQPIRPPLPEADRRQRVDEYASLLFKSALRQIEGK
jgi:hypothetical protein